jgi:uncharacterized protein
MIRAMLSEPLPAIFDVRKAAVRGASVCGVVKPQDLKRFRPLLGSDEGGISVEMAFSRDDESRYLVHVAVEADVVVTCQRCLEAMPEHFSCESTLAILWTDEEAAHLPRHLDPLVVREPSCSLWDLVEDELILAMSPFSSHGTEDCKMKTAAYSEPDPQQGIDDEDKPNPFNVLEQLRPGNKH